jgi:hypothetical protein
MLHSTHARPKPPLRHGQAAARGAGADYRASPQRSLARARPAPCHAHLALRPPLCAAEWLPATIAALDSFAAAPFALRFDRIENRKAVTLRTRDPLAEARAFQKALVNHLLREKAPIMDGTTPEPHITINYRGDRLGSETLGKKTPPIGWTVGEIILMESIVGKTTHVEHGRWPLRA